MRMSKEQGWHSVALRDDLFHGHVSLERGPGWVKPWRIPHWEKELYPPDALIERAAAAAGVRLRFKTDAAAVSLDVQAEEPGGQIDCLVAGERLDAAPVQAGQPAAIHFSLPAGEKVVELYLPQTCPVTVHRLAIPAGAALQPAPETGPRWITYGSSITQCAAADGPSQTWPALVARAMGYNLTCLGYGGNCHLETMLARLIRDLPADVITLCLGINVYGAASMGPRTFKSAVIGLIRTVREKHPRVPIGVISPIASPPRESTPNAVGFTLQSMREEIEDAVRRLQRVGDDRLVYVSGLDIFNLEDAEKHMPDQLHPNAEGYRIMARRIVERLFSHPLFQNVSGREAKGA